MKSMRGESCQDRYEDLIPLIDREKSIYKQTCEITEQITGQCIRLHMLAYQELSVSQVGCCPIWKCGRLKHTDVAIGHLKCSCALTATPDLCTIILQFSHPALLCEANHCQGCVLMITALHPQIEHEQVHPQASPHHRFGV